MANAPLLTAVQHESLDCLHCPGIDWAGSRLTPPSFDELGHLNLGRKIPCLDERHICVLGYQLARELAVSQVFVLNEAWWVRRLLK